MEELEKKVKELEDEIAKINEQLKEKSDEATKEEKEERLKEIEEEVDKLNEEKAKLEESRKSVIKQMEIRSKAAFNPVASYLPGRSAGLEARKIDNTELEKRTAFMEYILTGKIPEKRADAITLTTDASAVVPNTIMKRVIKELKEYGQIWARITKSNVKGGISIPVATLKPKATWVGENTVADKQKYPVNSNVSFLYHKLQCRVAISLEVDTTTLEVFEDSLVDAMKEAMIVALEQAVLNGTGNKQPLGITKHENVKVVELTEEEIRTYRGWIKAKKAVPASYKKRISFILNDSDFTNYIEGMVDSNGQPVGRVNYGLNGKETTKVLGKEAILVEDDYLPSFDTAEAGTVFGVICDLSDYLFNSNMEIVIKRYFDEDLDQWITKATLIGDGKMSSTQSVVLLKKKATSTKADGEGKGTQETPQV